MIRFVLHYGCHFIVPFLFAFVFYPHRKWFAYSVFVLAIVIDIDHLWAEPIYDPNRCSIGFHTFHSVYALGFYVLLLAFPKTRIVGFALLWHLVTDGLDCWMMRY